MLHQFAFVHPRNDQIIVSPDGKTRNFIHSKNRLSDDFLTFDEFFQFCLMLPETTRCQSINSTRGNNTITTTFSIGNDSVMKIHVDKQPDLEHKFKVRILKPELLKFETYGKVNDTSENFIFILKTDTPNEVFQNIYKYHKPTKLDPSHPFRKFLKHIQNIAPKSIHELIQTASFDQSYIRQKEKNQMSNKNKALKENK